MASEPWPQSAPRWGLGQGDRRGEGGEVGEEALCMMHDWAVALLASRETWEEADQPLATHAPPALAL